MRFIKNVIPKEIRALRWGNSDLLRRRVWSHLSSCAITEELERGSLYKTKNRPFNNVHSLHGNPAVSKIFSGLVPFEQEESVSVITRTAFIEPEVGWIIVNPIHLVENCLIDSWLVPRPMLQRYVKARLFPRRHIIRTPSVISLRDSGEANYYHVLSDLIGGRLRLAEQCGLSSDIPLLVGKKLYDRPFFQDFLRKGAFDRGRLLIQDKTYIQSERTFFFQTAFFTVRNADYVTRLLKVSDSDPASQRRIFLTRSPQAGRNIANEEAIRDICREFDFEVVDTERMSLDEQIQLFSTTRYLVGIHGAGLLNIIFRRNAMLSLLEILPPTSYDVRNPQLEPAVPRGHFFWCARTLGFGYDVIIGSEVAGNRGGNYQFPFEVNAELLATKIRMMLS